MNRVLFVAVGVYVLGGFLTRWRVDVVPGSTGRLTMLWPYYAVKYPRAFSDAVTGEKEWATSMLQMAAAE